MKNSPAKKVMLSNPVKAAVSLFVMLSFRYASKMAVRLFYAAVTRLSLLVRSLVAG